MRHILAFLGFGRSARLARMARKATERVRRSYGPSLGFFPAEYRRPPGDSEPLSGWWGDKATYSDAGNVQQRRYIGHGAGFTYPTAKVPPYRAGWGIPV